MVLRPILSSISIIILLASSLPAAGTPRVRKVFRGPNVETVWQMADGRAFKGSRGDIKERHIS